MVLGNKNEVEESSLGISSDGTLATRPLTAVTIEKSAIAKLPCVRRILVLNRCHIQLDGRLRHKLRRQKHHPLTRSDRPDQLAVPRLVG